MEATQARTQEVDGVKSRVTDLTAYVEQLAGVVRELVTNVEAQQAGAGAAAELELVKGMLFELTTRVDAQQMAVSGWMGGGQI